MKKNEGRGVQNAQLDADKQRIRFEQQLQKIKNEMDLVEILCNFWPFPNMNAKHRRLKAQLNEVSQSLKELDNPSKEHSVESAQAKASDPFVVLHSSPFKRRALIQ